MKILWTKFDLCCREYVKFSTKKLWEFSVYFAYYCRHSILNKTLHPPFSFLQTCNKYQEYRQSECRCICTNTDEEKKCYKNHSKKLWNPDLCACQCRDVFQCSTGQYFDNHECKCVSSPVRRRFATIDTPEVPPVDDESI